MEIDDNELEVLIKDLEWRVEYKRQKAVEKAESVKRMMDDYLRGLTNKEDPHAPGVGYFDHEDLFRSMGEFEEVKNALTKLKWLVKDRDG